ncbi:hypothetical protein [Nonomuraea roseoviolacea]|uniref:Uncharacterized protein n=1 Tax=Nonomuraea roseoviolacea subsp. carminata TaxID=160689 RepID=A0ABT1KGK4_9ACTN|nr:hypothetical protein [Nonomuraea roseoviolacea]MCP2352794.1 hypothetical protein [Nonomuraea roseoviolacea subsp. carminata]
MAAPRMISCVLALATLTLGACSAATDRPSGGQPVVSGVAGGSGAAPSAGPPSGTAAAPPGTAAPSASALDPAAYKAELESRRKAMAGAIGSMAGARTVKTLGQRAQKAAEAVESGAAALAAVTPPDQVRSQHDAYVASLRDFATALGGTAGKVGSRDLCTSSAALTDVGGALKSLDQAGQALQRAGDYPADVVSVKAGGKKNRRLKNGSFIRRGSLTGRSSLQIDNGGTRDAVVTLVKGGSKVVSVYVRKKAKFKISGVRDGTYKIYFTHGVDWDGRARAFTRQCSFERFQKSVKFKTTFTATQIRWHDWRITLHAIAGGNARTADVDPDDFPG